MKKYMIGLLLVLPVVLSACGTKDQVAVPPGNKTQDNANTQGTQLNTATTMSNGGNQPGSQPETTPSTVSKTTSDKVISNPPPAPSGQVIANPPYIETASADAVVTEYYYAMGRRDYETAWMMIHPGTKAKVTKSSFESKQKPVATKNVSNLLKQTLDEYKIYSTEIRYTNVAVVEASFSDGSKKTIHLVKGDQGQGWKLFWNPETNDVE